MISRSYVLATFVHSIRSMTKRITARGRELASALNPYLGTTREILEVCSLVARHATTHQRLQEAQCNRELTKREIAQEARIEARIRDLVSLLPHTGGGVITVRFSGDPRGFTVKLHVPNQPASGNTWGLDGDYGV